jgi:hypothetical protein
MPGNVVGVNDDDFLNASRDERSECRFPRPAPAVDANEQRSGARTPRQHEASMSDTGTIAHSLVAHLPLTAIHQRDAVFGRVPAAGMTRTNADGTANQPRRGRYDGAMIEFVAVQMGQSQFFPNLGECQWRCVADTCEAGHAVFAVGPGALLHDRTRGLPPPPQGVAPLC